MKKAKLFLCKLLLGNQNKVHHPKSFYLKQKENLIKIWENSEYKDFGIERLLRLTLQLTAFLTPSGIIRYITGKTKNLLFRKIGVEIYAISKIIFIYTAFKFDWTTNVFVLCLIIFLSLDTLHFLISRVFLNDVFREAISYKRSLIMIIINYIELGLCFAFIYSFFDDSNKDISNPTFLINESIRASDNHLTDTQTIYYSFITSATIGYGDISPRDSLVMKLVIAQVIISLFFVVVFISNTINRINEETFLNRKNKPINKSN